MREYALVLCVAAAVTFLLTPIARRIALGIGAVSQPRERDVHKFATPYGGGVAMYAGVCAAFLVAHSLPALHAVFTYSDVEAAVVSGGVMLVLGVVDDRFDLDPLTKLAGQVVAAGVMVLLGLQILTVSVPVIGSISLGTVGVPLTVILTLMTVNAMNFIDGLDGLAAGVGAIAALAFFLFSYSLSSGTVTQGVAEQRISSPTLMAAVLAGACLGFLPHNFSPARVFMGDAGAYLIGLMLSAMVTSLTGQFDYSSLPATTSFPVLLPLLLPLAVLAVPLANVLFVVVRRARAGVHPVRALGGEGVPSALHKMHLHHLLVELGHSDVRAVLIMYFWTALIGFGAVAVAITGGVLKVLGVVLVVGLGALIASNMPRLRSRTR